MVSERVSNQYLSRWSLLHQSIIRDLMWLLRPLSLLVVDGVSLHQLADRYKCLLCRLRTQLPRRTWKILIWTSFTSQSSTGYPSSIALTVVVTNLENLMGNKYFLPKIQVCIRLEFITGIKFLFSLVEKTHRALSRAKF